MSLQWSLLTSSWRSNTMHLNISCRIHATVIIIHFQQVDLSRIRGKFQIEKLKKTQWKDKFHSDRICIVKIPSPNWCTEHFGVSLTTSGTGMSRWRGSLHRMHCPQASALGSGLLNQSNSPCWASSFYELCELALLGEEERGGDLGCHLKGNWRHQITSSAPRGELEPLWSTSLGHLEWVQQNVTDLTVKGM